MATNFMDLTNRVAVVIGGTSGLGYSIAIGMAKAGANVVATGRRREQAEQVYADICRTGQTSLLQTTDITDRKSIDNLRDAVEHQLGGVDILVNAAGRTVRKPTAEQDISEWQAIMDTNLTGMLYACQSFYRLLRTSVHGRIINIASLASFVGFFEVTAYSTSKAGVLALTRSLAIEWARERINVNALVPGVFRTALNSELLDNTERGRELLMRTPMRRFGTAEELIGAAVFLASDAASFITGQSIVVDGGFLASGVNS
jgi:NAD(P)-dependent dehydrogenase (short-subunit alcohol dehydrogenase family)